jgi:hypothetical protein
LGLGLGGLVGLLLVFSLLSLIRPVIPPAVVQTNPITPDVTIFVSEQSLSRFASAALKSPVVIDFEPEGQMRVTARTQMAGFEPVVQMGLLLELQGTEVTSRLYWVQLGFLALPASWLPPEVGETAALVGQTINAQMPPEFTLVGLATDSQGITFQLKWVGR